MSSLAALPIPEEAPGPQAPALVFVPGSGSWLPELTPTDARRLAVSLLGQAEEVSPSPLDVGVLPYGWTRISLIVPSLELAAVVDLARDLRAQGMSYPRIARELKARGLKTQTGGDWHQKAVQRLLKAWPAETRKRWTVPTVHRLL